MREIKFRGKINKESDFIYGSLLVIGEETYIYQHDYGDLDDIDFGYAFEKVLHETVGQFTCLNDKNGKEIYEGDIVEHYVNFGPCGDHPGHRTAIEMTPFGLNLQMWVFNGNNPRPVIIGNIHENPELINER